MIENFLIQNLSTFFLIGVFCMCGYILVPDKLFKFKILLLIIGTVLISSTLYYAGKKDERISNDLVKANIEKQLAEAKAKSANKTIQVVTEYVDRVKVIEKEKIVYQTKIDEVLNEEIVTKYPVPNGFIRLHNSAAEGSIPGGSRDTDEEPSPVKINQVTETVVDNYLMCRENTEQLVSLQSWIREQQVLFNNK
jgi:hypothetical protein